jgi:hypothetical protein
MPDLIVNLLLATLLAGAFLGWQARGVLADRDLYRAEERRDAEWDTEHGVGENR